MKKFYCFVVVYFLCIFKVMSGDIRYGYNAQGEYVPMEIDGQNVQYGYNAQGEYVPMQIGDNSVQYGYNAQGNFVPTAVGNAKIGYGYNPQGDYVPIFVGNEQIDYGYNAQGEYVPTSVGKAQSIISVLGSALSDSSSGIAPSSSGDTLFPNYNSKTKKWKHSWKKS